MHSYTTNSDERKNIFLCLAGLSVFFAWLFDWGVKKLGMQIPWWVDAPSVIAFYGALYKIFDTWIWKWPIVQTLGLVKTPDLSGLWNAFIQSEYDGHSAKYSANVEIAQTWTQINILLRSDTSKSHSLTAMIAARSRNAADLSYEFLNEPIASAAATMHAHRGTARLVFSRNENVDVLDGEYYSGRDRKNVGLIRLEKPRKT